MDKECRDRINNIAKKFKSCRKTISALGDENRQLIIIALLNEDYKGVRVGQISKRTHLSRTSVSHHLKLLKEANIVDMRREGTKNYYYLNSNSNETGWKDISELMNLISSSIEYMKN